MGRGGADPFGGCGETIRQKSIEGHEGVRVRKKRQRHITEAETVPETWSELGKTC